MCTKPVHSYILISATTARYRQTGKQTDRQTDRQMDRQANRQIDTYTHTQRIRTYMHAHINWFQTTYGSGLAESTFKHIETNVHSV